MVGAVGLNESPSEKEGKCETLAAPAAVARASMKVPPKRKGNTCEARNWNRTCLRLNESPSEKEGKYWRAEGDFVGVHVPQ